MEPKRLFSGRYRANNKFYLRPLHLQLQYSSHAIKVYKKCIHSSLCREITQLCLWEGIMDIRVLCTLFICWHIYWEDTRQ